MGVSEGKKLDYEKLKKKNKLYVIIIAILCVFLILSVMFSWALLYGLFELNNEEDDDGISEHDFKFRVDLIQKENEKLLIIHQEEGYIFDFADCRIVITNKSDESDISYLQNFYGILAKGESITITNITCKRATIYDSAFAHYELTVGNEYQIELRSVLESFDYSYDVICKSE